MTYQEVARYLTAEPSTARQIAERIDFTRTDWWTARINAALRGAVARRLADRRQEWINGKLTFVYWRT